MSLGQGEFRYRLTPFRGRLPALWKYENSSDVGIDSHGRIYVIDRGPHPVLVFEPDGTFVGSWGEGGIFRKPHGIFVDSHDAIYVTDFSTQQVLKFTKDGKLLLELGNRDLPSGTYYGEPFNMPTGVTVSPSGNILVSDGYGNYKVQKFSGEGKLLGSWGRPGKGPGEFALVHSLDVDRNGRVYVCDRENERIQIFDEDGRFLNQWTGLNLPSDICVKGDVAYVTEQGLTHPPRISIFALDGTLLSRWGEEGEAQTILRSPHGIQVNPDGVIFVAQVMVNCEPRVYTFTPVR
jgi:DNA-binding beta-propeller fold protein YncE